jgi:transcriptional accessory protein Tex/SPT6
MQNIPVRKEIGRNMRKFFVAKDGYELVDADYSQIELRVLACVCGDENMQQAFLSGKDIHRSTAAQVFDLPEDFVSDEVGLPTLQDIWRELDKPSRDPRNQIEEFRFSEAVHSIDDLQEGMSLPGIVTNISNFGAFVDMGIHKDGLIHVSQLRGKTLALHQHLTVEVLSIDRERNRISLKPANS